MTITAYKWSIDRYHQLIEMGLLDDALSQGLSQQSVELLQGEIIVMSPEGESHAYYNTEVAEYLRELLGARAKIRDAKPITLPNDSEPVPDIAIVQPLGTIYLEHHPYPENIFWLIEFANTTIKKDLGLKKEIYAAAGILEYWVVNLQTTELKVFRDLVDGTYCEKLTFTNGTIQPRSFPDKIVDIQRLLRA
ncbi:Uma2 family endonuclease [Chamaesiphon sp. OTE_20_metabat_361]|uniref:Uma2 family endonuclease n=1 Tax=Chamaesiphon sp. OTE_20_metabat_361 TaxID=2964689 RepID=UPI00286A7444|nr:Uma2 family endonuclease [Chamaesiphon sp. OTE_20_metabat_361]